MAEPSDRKEGQADIRAGTTQEALAPVSGGAPQRGSAAVPEQKVEIRKTFEDDVPKYRGKRAGEGEEPVVDHEPPK